MNTACRRNAHLPAEQQKNQQGVYLEMNVLSKRVLPFLMVMVMIFAMMPVQAFATDVEGHDHDAELSSIVVSTLPDKVEYVLGEELDVTGGVLTLCYGQSHTHTAQMTADMVTGFDSSMIGQQTLTVSYEGLTAKFDVTVSAAAQSNPAVAQFQAQIDDMLNWYLGTTSMSREQIEAAVAQMDTDTLWMAQVEIMDLEAAMEEELTEAECVALVEANPVFCDFADVVSATAAGPNLLTEVTALDGQLTFVDDQNTITVSGTTVTATVTSSFTTRKTSTITITNNSGSTATLSFDYSASNLDKEAGVAYNEEK